MNETGKVRWMVLPIALASLLGPPTARADVVTDWNITANEVVAGLPPPPANRTLAMVQTAVYEAVNAITKRYPADRVTPNAAPDASVAAAVASANRAMLSRLVPSQQPAIDNSYGAALAAIADGPALGEPPPPGVQPSFLLHDDALAMTANGCQGLQRTRTQGPPSSVRFKDIGLD